MKINLTPMLLNVTQPAAECGLLMGLTPGMTEYHARPRHCSATFSCVMLHRMAAEMVKIQNLKFSFYLLYCFSIKNIKQTGVEWTL